MKLDFVILGAQKCATTSLFVSLAQHPDLVGCRTKEPHFFSTSPDWERELPSYEALFPDQDGALRFEASTSYTFYPHRNLEIWEDLFEYNPELKFIYLVRNPVDRICSSYMHNVARGYTKQPIGRAIRRCPLFLDATRYYTQIIPYIRRFGRERVLLLDFEDFVRHPRRSLRRVADFLEVDADGFHEVEGVHANPSVGGWKQHHRFDSVPRVVRGVGRLLPNFWGAFVRGCSPKIGEKAELSLDLQRMVLHMLEGEICEMERLMEKDLSHWRCVGGRTCHRPQPRQCARPSRPNVQATDETFARHSE